MSKTTVIEVRHSDVIEIDNHRDIADDIEFKITTLDDYIYVFLNREQTKQLIEHLQSTLEDE